MAESEAHFDPFVSEARFDPIMVEVKRADEVMNAVDRSFSSMAVAEDHFDSTLSEARFDPIMVEVKRADEVMNAVDPSFSSMAEAPAPPMVAEAKMEEEEEEEEKGPGHYHIERPNLFIREPRVEYVPVPAPAPAPSSSISTIVVVELTWKRVRQYSTTINGAYVPDRRSGPLETLGFSVSFLYSAALLAAASSADPTTPPLGDTWLDLFASLPAFAHLVPCLPGSVLRLLSTDLNNALANRPPPPHLPAATVVYRQEITIVDTLIHDDSLVLVRDLLTDIGTPARLAGARCGACRALYRRELDFLRLPCSHAFHIKCIFNVFWNWDTRCPTCRRSFSRNDHA